MVIPEQVDAAPANFQVFQRLPIGSLSLFMQQLLQQVHVRDQVCYRSAEHQSPVRLVMARLEEERLARGAPNQRHHVAQVP